MTGLLPRRFALLRQVNYTGVSGLGVVAYGIAFADGHVALRWCTDRPSTSVWESLEDLLSVHGEPAEFTVEWIDTPAGERARSGGRRARPSSAPVGSGVPNGFSPGSDAARGPSDAAPAPSEPPPPSPKPAETPAGTALHAPGRHRRSRPVEQSV